MFENFLVWYKNDPTAKNKIAFFIGLCVFFPVLFVSIWWLNLPKNTPKTEISNTNSIKRPQITQANFENSPQLEIIDNEPLGNLSQIYFQKNQIFSFSQNGNLKVDGQNLPSSPNFSPLSFYNSSGFLVINEQKQSTIFENKTGIFTRVENGISQVLPFENQFYYFFGRGNNLTIRRADNITLSQNIATLVNFSLPDVNSWAEMRAINGQIFIFIYSDSNRQGEIFVQKLEQNTTQNSLKFVQTWKNVQSLLFGINSVILTQNGTSEPYISKVINFRDFEEFVIDNKKVRELGIKGQIWAERCSFENRKSNIEIQNSQTNSSNSIFCLVKNEDVFVFNSTESDKIIKIDITTNKFEKVLDTLIFSASYIYSDNSQIYIINPLKDLLYRFKI